MRVQWWAQSEWWQVPLPSVHRPPELWRSMPHELVLYCIVNLSTPPSKNEKFSSVLNFIPTWSMIVSLTPLLKLRQSPPVPFFPCRMRKWRITTLSPQTSIRPPFREMPSPGAVWPAMVTLCGT